jgi:acyl-coenzyme A synthetase/AMP-(fatty) acid ligase
VVPVPSAPDSLVDDLDAFCEANLVSYKRPREWHVVESIPRNALGKILRHQLRVG